jgi:RND family efflux transporter MFP subunit
MNVENEVMHEVRRPPVPRRRLGWVLLGSLGALGLLAIGAVGALLVERYMGDMPMGLGVAAQAPPSTSAPEVPPAPAAPSPPAAVEILLTPEALAQVGIKTAPVTVVEASVTTQLPGSVMADAYREVKVVPVVGGIVTRVHVELGATVKRGTPLATLFSPALSEAQTKYLSMQAMVTADYQKLQRTRQLVEIGAASRQELEEVTAVHDSHATEAAAAQQRLLLLGLRQEQVQTLRSPSQIVSEVVVPAPIAGVITGRSANLGQVLSMGQELFVVTDLSQVWVIGDLYEQDFQRLGIGTAAVLTTPAYPSLTWRGRVTYIDPRIDTQTRTAKVRVEVPNRDGQLRLGMYMTMACTTPGGERRVVVPRSAVQTLGERQVVFVSVPDEAGKFVQRPVHVGPLEGEVYPVLAGLQPGEHVVTEGSFFLRAESLRANPASL